MKEFYGFPVDLPSCYEADLEDALLRVARWRNDDLCVIFPVITDLHSALETTDPLFGQRRDSASHILLMNDVADKFQADFTVDLGDEGIDVPLKNHDEMEKLTARILQYRRVSKQRPALFVKGNHDTRLTGFPDHFWEKAFMEINSGVPMTYGGDGSYGFFDVPGKKTRVFSLNTSECGEFLSDAQLDFLKKNLDLLEKDHCAVVLQHICSFRIIYQGVKREARPFPSGLEKLDRILKEFVRRGGRLAGSISGHGHYNADVMDDGVNNFTLQGYGGIGPRESPPFARIALEFDPLLDRTDTFDMTKYCMIHLVVIKPELGAMKIFRIGAGGSACDTGAYF